MACPRQPGEGERRSAFDGLFAVLRAPECGPSEIEEALARANERREASPHLESLSAPFVLAGAVDGRGCFLRERHGSFRVEVAPDEDPGRDVWRAAPKSSHS